MNMFESLGPDEEYEAHTAPERLPATDANIAKAKAFVMKKWVERFHEKYGRIAPPTDLSNACKFTSLFAREVFGGRIMGSEHHQFVSMPDGKVIDLNDGAKDVQDIRDAGEDPHEHDEYFWGNPDHRDSIESIKPRVEKWVEEFFS